MAMTKAGMKDTMKAATASKTSASTAVPALGNAIAKYIVDNAEITFAWVGVGPPPASLPDPVVTAKGKIITCIIALTASMAPDKTTADTMMSLQIYTGVMAAIYNMPEGWVTSPGTLSTIPPASFSASGDTLDKAYESLAGQIIDWILGYIPVLPCAGVHGIFIGTGTPTVIA